MITLFKNMWKMNTQYYYLQNNSTIYYEDPKE